MTEDPRVPVQDMKPEAPATTEQKPEQPRVEIFISPDGELMISIPLRQINRTFARGVLEDARDAMDNWYKKQLEGRMALRQKGFPVKAREALAKIGGLFIPK